MAGGQAAEVSEFLFGRFAADHAAIAIAISGVKVKVAVAACFSRPPPFPSSSHCFSCPPPFPSSSHCFSRPPPAGCRCRRSVAADVSMPGTGCFEFGPNSELVRALHTDQPTYPARSCGGKPQILPMLRTSTSNSLALVPRLLRSLEQFALGLAMLAQSTVRPSKTLYFV
uniref:Uncharacterized protein n=1 Tax=Oryza sativa subsp. japonica TaxID=39947 RepID=Q6ZGW4_ORYSJ|nr:hypothetical protein [Oryza sativa Japonica Group]BAD12889.1 hypothetical protein [Oryza sativa Japonica Group]